MPIVLTGRARPARVAALALLLALGAPGATGGVPPTSVADGGAARTLAWVAPPTSGARMPGTAEDGTAEDGDRPARLTLAPGGRDLVLSGDLTEGVAARVAVILAGHPQVERLHLTSDGGLVAEATALVRLVRARHLATYVPDTCVSACTLVFVNGRRRALAPEGRLGFHAPYVVGKEGRMRAVDPAPERAAYRAAGLPRAFVARVMTVAPADIWIPTTAQLRAAGVVTDVATEGAGPEAPSPARAPWRSSGGP